MTAGATQIDLQSELQQIALSQGVDLEFKEHRSSKHGTLLYPVANRISIDIQTWNKQVATRRLPVRLRENQDKLQMFTAGQVIVPPIFFVVIDRHSLGSEDSRVMLFLKCLFFLVMTVVAVWMTVIKRPA